uniref:Uncharacterized protein n=1 Tax=Physcomitrium patens TaxID=3218 RepID=A0A2K1J4E3_PHYPA|nr:hypothetical protein PHYPA_022250 [Physcomitrium patens]
MNESNRHQYNIFTIFQEIAIILLRNGLKSIEFCDIIICLHNNGLLKKIHEAHHAHLSLHYILFFPHGAFRWYLCLRTQNIVIDIAEEGEGVGQQD